MFRKFFPKGIAKEGQFFNRTKELKRLVGNLENVVHTVLVAPRRYGKTSLAKEAIRQTGYPSVELDLFVATSEVDVGQKIVAAVSDLIGQISSDSEQWLHSLRDYFARANKKWTIGIKGFKLELVPDNIKTVPQNILDALEALEHLLSDQDKKAVLYIDEFQEVLETDSGKAIEGAIRHFAQEALHVVIIFSGSNRRMLKKIFNDRSRPLYSLCDEIRLDRIDANYYITYLRMISKETYGTELSDSVIDEILRLSDRHPKYVYLLALEVWLASEDALPTVGLVQAVWREYVLIKRKDVRIELASRTQTQLKILTEIANGNDSALSGQVNQHALVLTSSSITQALRVLEEHDFIERTKEGIYRIIDPLIKSSLMDM